MLEERRRRLSSGGSDTTSDVSSMPDEDSDVEFFRVEKEFKLETMKLGLVGMKTERAALDAGATAAAAAAAGVGHASVAAAAPAAAADAGAGTAAATAPVAGAAVSRHVPFKPGSRGSYKKKVSALIHALYFICIVERIDYSPNTHYFENIE